MILILPFFLSLPLNAEKPDSMTAYERCMEKVNAQSKQYQAQAQVQAQRMQADVQNYARAAANSRGGSPPPPAWMANPQAMRGMMNNAMQQSQQTQQQAQQCRQYLPKADTLKLDPSRKKTFQEMEAERKARAQEALKPQKTFQQMEAERKARIEQMYKPKKTYEQMEAERKARAQEALKPDKTFQQMESERQERARQMLDRNKAKQQPQQEVQPGGSPPSAVEAQKMGLLQKIDELKKAGVEETDPTMQSLRKAVQNLPAEAPPAATRAEGGEAPSALGPSAHSEGFRINPVQMSPAQNSSQIKPTDIRPSIGDSSSQSQAGVQTQEGDSSAETQVGTQSQEGPESQSPAEAPSQESYSQPAPIESGPAVQPSVPSGDLSWEQSMGPQQAEEFQSAPTPARTEPRRDPTPPSRKPPSGMRDAGSASKGGGSGQVWSNKYIFGPMPSQNPGGGGAASLPTSPGSAAQKVQPLPAPEKSPEQEKLEQKIWTVKKKLENLKPPQEPDAEASAMDKQLYQTRLSDYNSTKLQLQLDLDDLEEQLESLK